METVDFIVGFDLGHGETALSYMGPGPGAVPDILEIGSRRSQITALGFIPDRGYVVGERACRDRTVRDLWIGFKAKPPATAKAREIIVEFVREYDRQARATGEIFGRVHYYVGCPSGWEAVEVEEYQRWLGEAVATVSVVRESRAALLQAKEKGLIEAELLKGSILVIDIGSLTTDVSHIFGGIQDQSIDLGIELGGHLFEKALLRDVLRNHPRREDVEVALGADGSPLRAALLADLRRLKEGYWVNEEVHSKDGCQLYWPIPGHRHLVVEADLNGKKVQQLLAEPLPELGRESWLERWQRLLVEVRAELRSRQALPGIVLLTGGAARMSFIPKSCKVVFPEATAVMCSPPEETVAFGLARWGNIEQLTTAFSEEVNEFCEGELRVLVKKRSPVMKEALAVELSRRIIEEVLREVLRRWKRREIYTLNGVEVEVSQGVRSWLESDAGKRAIESALKPAIKDLTHDINSKTDDICLRAGIRRDSLRLNAVPKVRGEGLEVGVESPFENSIRIGQVVTFAALIVLTGVAKGTILAVSASTGPPGWLVGALLLTWGALFGMQALEDKLRSADIPEMLRSIFLTDSRLGALAADAQGKLAAELRTALGEREMNTIEQAISEQVQAQLNARANELKWILT